MAENRELYHRLWTELRQAEDTDELLEQIQVLDHFSTESKITASQIADLRLVAFRALRDLTSNNSELASDLLVSELLPYCLLSDKEIPQDANYTFGQYRVCLAEWVSSYPEVDRTVIRNRVFDELRQALDTDGRQGAIRTFGVIGYREPALTNAIWRLAHRQDDIGELAVFALADLGISGAERKQLLSLLNRRLQVHCNLLLVGALRRLALPESIDTITDSCLRSNNGSDRSSLQLVALRVLTDVSDSHHRNEELQDLIWSKLMQMATSDLDIVMSSLMLGNDMAPRCNTPRVVPDLLGQILETTTESENAEHRRYLFLLRLSECVRPQQILGWHGASNASLLAALRHDAIHDTGYSGRATTAEYMHKEITWQTLLRLGYEDTLGWFEAAVAIEANPFLSQRITRMLSCFRLEPLPPTAVKWLTERYERVPTDTSGEWAARMGVIQLARSAATREAFSALLDFGFTIKEGDVLQESVDALAETAIFLLQQGNQGVSEMLLDTALYAPEKHHRWAGAGALQLVAAAGSLPARFLPDLAGAVRDETRDSFERSLLTAAVGHMSIGELGSEFRTLLYTLAESRTDRLGTSAIEALARSGYLVESPKLLAKRLGLVRVGEQWEWLPHEDARFEWAAFIIGLLYLQDPSAFMPAVCSILKSHDWYAAIQLVRIIDHGYYNLGSVAAPLQVKKALLKRAQLRQSRSYAETELFHVLGRLAPDALAHENWEQYWDNWLPQARVSLAEALTTASFTETRSLTRVRFMMLELTGDGLYAVIRSAFRALAVQLPEVLESLCIAWSNSKSPVELRKRAAEATGWLPDYGEHDERFNDVLAAVLTDPEREVRESARNARLERRERQWASHYLARVLGSAPFKNQQILQAWPYGEALKQVGDETSSRAISRYLGTHSVPPHARFWLREIRNGIDERLRTVRKSWPEPWATLEGSFLETRGAVVFANRDSVKVDFSLWYRPAAAPAMKHSWGGIASTQDIDEDFSFVGPQSEIELVLEDGRRGKAIPSRMTNKSILFFGKGPYPGERTTLD